ncbi:hypothetical protein BJX99DRAFT_252867 [Aspergillus californicus]
MPSATATLGWTLANWGPVPSTYTLASASSCTASSDIYLAHTSLPEGPLWLETCTAHTLDRCWPQPTNSALAQDAFENQYVVSYWSPGTACPSGWKSVGAAEYPTDGPVTSTGIFTVNPGRYDGDDDGWDDWDDWLTGDDDGGVVFGERDAIGALLDEGETAVACCPSTMSIGRNGLCFSTLPSRAITTACQALYRDDLHSLVSTTYEISGSTRTGAILIPATETFWLPTATRTTTFDEHETDRLVAATMASPVYIVHQGNGSESESSASGTGAGDSQSADETNAAGRIGGGAGWEGGRAVFGVLVVSVLAGVGLVLPW